MSETYLSSAPEAHQQQGSLSLKEFAKLNNLTTHQVLYLAKKGLILGACKNHSDRWLVFPPAKLLHRPSPRKPRAVKRMAVQAAAAESTAAKRGGAGGARCAGAFDFGTSPHGLPVNGSQMQSQSNRNSGAESLADGFEVLLGQEEVSQVSNTALPEVFGSAQLKAAARTIALGGSTLCYPVVLTGRQILAIEKAVAHDLNGLEQQADWHEFEPEQVALHDSERATLQATLRIIRNAVTETNQANARTQRTGAWR